MGNELLAIVDVDALFGFARQFATVEIVVTVGAVVVDGLDGVDAGDILQHHADAVVGVV